MLSSAVLTPAGRGAVATISVRGPAVELTEAIDRHFVAANGRSLADQPQDRICFGTWTSESDASLKEAEASDPEEVVVLRRDEETVEVCCHGGPTAVDRILFDLRKLSIPTVPWPEQIAAASTSLEAELQEAVSRATTRRTALKLLEQQSILPVEFARFTQLAACLLEDFDASATALSTSLAASLKWSSFGLHLTSPWRVVLAGRPNVGKSTLMNALAGFDRAIVYDKPGTTRDVVSVETALDGWPVQLLDTAGIRDATNEIEREGVSRSRRALDEADCVCLLLDAGSPLTDEDRQLMAEVAASSTPSIFVASKSDLDRVWGKAVASGSGLNEVSVSAVNDVGVDQLIEAIVRQLVPEGPPAQTAVPVTLRQVGLLTAARAAAELGDWAAALAELEKLNHGKDGRHGKE